MTYEELFFKKYEPGALISIFLKMIKDTNGSEDKEDDSDYVQP